MLFSSTARMVNRTWMRRFWEILESDLVTLKNCYVTLPHMEKDLEMDHMHGVAQNIRLD